MAHKNIPSPTRSILVLNEISDLTFENYVPQKHSLNVFKNIYCLEYHEYDLLLKDSEYEGPF